MDLSIPRPLVALPWGSRSTKSTFFPISPNAAERLIAVVDFPTPPFWLMMAITFVLRSSDGTAGVSNSKSAILAAPDFFFSIIKSSESHGNAASFLSIAPE